MRSVSSPHGLPSTILPAVESDPAPGTSFEAVGTQNPHDTEIDLSVYGMSDAWFFNLWEPYLLGLW